MNSSGVPKRVRTLFLSDLHLGCRLSNGPRCLELLNNVQAERLYLLGDLVDVSRLARLWYWPDSHQRVVDAICRIHRAGTQVSIAPGNHDQCFRDKHFFDKLNSRHRIPIEQIVAPLMDMTVAESFDYETLAGKRMLLTHGDLFDGVESRFGGIPGWGSRTFDRISWHLPRPITHFLRRIFKWVLSRPDQVEASIAAHAVKSKFDGVIFGHLHAARIKQIEGHIIVNTGDWILNESFLAETLDGHLQLFNFGACVPTTVVAVSKR